jgi:hypothetical protein
MHQRLGVANRALSSALAGGELRNLVTLPADLKAYRPHPVEHLPEARKRLWKFHD